MKAGQAAAAGVALLALTGCSGVVSTTPWFTRADAIGAPELRAGVWRASSSADKPCAVDERQPIGDWPECAAPLIVSRRDIVMGTEENGHRRWLPIHYVLATGQPLILQVADTHAKTKQYEYEWVRITGLDDAGRVTSLVGWRVLCGPPSPGDGKPALYPGIAHRDGDCLAASREALRGAAKASEADATDTAALHWVRDGTK